MKKKIFTMILSLLLSVSPINLLENSNSIVTTAAADSGIQLYGNQTGYKYKFNNGKLWKRLWSYTYNRWEEPSWTPVN